MSNNTATPYNQIITYNSIAELSTFSSDGSPNPLDGQTCRVLGYTVPGDSGDSWEMIYRTTGRSGVTMDGGFYVAGPGADDYWEAADKTVAIATRFGCVADYTYPFNGTDNTAAFNAMFAAADDIKVIIPIGEYLIMDTVTVPHSIELEAKGAILSYRGTRDRHVLHFTDTMGRRKLELPSVTGHYNSLTIAYGEEQWAAVVFTGSTVDNDIYLAGCNGMPVGFLAHPDPAKFFAYNRVYGGTFANTKVGIELRGNTSTGWVNENSFYGPNFTTTSNAKNAGSLAGVKFSAVAGGYTGQNNNRFFAPCFQVQGYVEADQKLEVGKAILLDRWYVNRDDDLGGILGQTEEYGEYVCTTQGTGGLATVPTHTTVGQEVVDGNGYGLTYVGKWWRSPVVYDGAGGMNIFRGCRWEGGDGPFVLVKAHTADVSQLNDHEYEGFGGVTRSYPAVRYEHTDPSVSSLSYHLSTSVHNYVSDPQKKQLHIDNLHLRGIQSAAGMTVAGFSTRNYFGGAAAGRTQNTSNIKFCTDGFYCAISGGVGLGTYVDWSNARLTYYGDSPVPADQRPRPYLMAIKDGARIPITNPSPDYLTSLSSINDTYDMFLAQPSQGAVASWMKNDEAYDGLFWAALWGTGKITSLSVRADKIGSSTLTNVRMHDGMGMDAVNPGYRITNGSPTGGFFNTPGEFIVNIDYTPAEPVGYRVTTPGYLAPAWVTATAYQDNEIVENGGNIYAANSAGTSGATAPTGTTTSNDDNIIW